VSFCNVIICHYHDPMPWYIWVLALIASVSRLASQQCDLLLRKRTECAAGYAEGRHDVGSAVSALWKQM
jgi:hypothetical protein